MSVLFKALQKAEKENEQRQAAAGGSGFDAGRLAGSGAIRLAGSRGVNWRTAGLATAVVLAVAIACAFFLVQPSSPPAPRVAALAPPPVAAPAPAESVPAPEAPAGEAAVAAPAPVPPESPAPAQQTAEAAPVTPPAPSAAPPAAPSARAAPETTAAAAPAPVAPAPEPAPAPEIKTAKAEPAAVRPAQTQPPRREPMPEIAADSPARMLNPPIAIQRAEFELSGVGNAVQVREVSQKAQDNVGAGYSALVNGAYDMSLGFYDRALKDEPTSVMALLGRGAALQKLGKAEEAHAAYERVLKIDPGNREALSNLTVITGERSPGEALAKLLELEKQYPAFSPIKAQIGLNYAKAGSMPQALDYLRRATALSPDSVMYHYNLALVLDHLGQSQQAVASYETVLSSLSGGRAVPELSATDIERRVRFLRTR